jgi:hypothetical protein
MGAPEYRLRAGFGLKCERDLRSRVLIGLKLNFANIIALPLLLGVGVEVLRQFARAVLAVEPTASGGPISILESARSCSPTTGTAPSTGSLTARQKAGGVVERGPRH